MQRESSDPTKLIVAIVILYPGFESFATSALCALPAVPLLSDTGSSAPAVVASYCPYAPQIEILKYANLTITHGGISTINESLYYGVPLITCSGANVDQNGNIARVVYHGVGLQCSTKPWNSIELESTVDYLLGDTRLQIRKNVRDIQSRLVEYRRSNSVTIFFTN